MHLPFLVDLRDHCVALHRLQQHPPHLEIEAPSGLAFSQLQLRGDLHPTLAVPARDELRAGCMCHRPCRAWLRRCCSASNASLRPWRLCVCFPLTLAASLPRRSAIPSPDQPHRCPRHAPRDFPHLVTRPPVPCVRELGHESLHALHSVSFSSPAPRPAPRSPSS